MAVNEMAIMVRNLARRKLREVLEDDNGLSKDDTDRVMSSMDEFAKTLASVEIEHEDMENMMLCVLGEAYVRKECPDPPEDTDTFTITSEP